MRLIFCLLLLSTNLHAFSLLSPVRLKSELVTSYINTIIVSSYQKIGIQPKIEYISENEINARIKSGNYDAIVSKIADKGSIEYGLQLLPPLIKNYKVYRWNLKKNPIKKTRFSIGAIKGVLAHTKTIIKNRALFSKVKYYSNYKQMTKALRAREIDSVLMSDQEYRHEIDKSLRDQFQKESKELISIDIHHYLHLKHKELFPALQKEFNKRHKLNSLTFDDYAKNYKKSSQK